jgi:hypothetical protein
MLAKRQVSWHVGKETGRWMEEERKILMEEDLLLREKRQVRVDRGGRWMEEERNILMEEDLLLTALP